MENVPRKKYKLRALPATLQPNALYYIKPIGSEEVTLYVTDKDGIPKELKDESGVGGTNLSYTPSPTQGTVVSDTGSDAIIPLANGINAGLSENNLTSSEKSLISTSLQSGDTTSELINNGSDGTSTYVETDELSIVAFSNNYNDLDNLPSIPSQYTDELAQDAVGNNLVDTSTINLIYNGTTGEIEANINPNSVTASELSNTINISEFVNNANYSTESYVDSKIVQTITDGDTTHAPSADIIHDKLLLKEDTSNKQTTMIGNTTSNVVFLTAKAIYDWGIGLFQPILTDVNLGAFINSLTSKTTPVDADSISIVDSVDSNKQKKVSFTNIKAFLKAYFDTIYSQRQALYFYPLSSTTTFTADQKNMHVSRFNTGSLYGSFGLTLGNGIPETGGVIDLSYLGDVGVPFIVPFNCIVEEVIIRYSRNVAESGANSNIMFRMMSDTRYNVDNQMICDYNLTGTTHIGNEEASVSVTVLSHSTITKGGGLKFCVRTNNATAQQYNIFRVMVIVKKV